MRALALLVPGDVDHMPLEQVIATALARSTAGVRRAERGVGAARWCPTCGDCRCPGWEDDDPPEDISDPGCPLHSPISPHGVAVSEEHEALRG